MHTCEPALVILALVATACVCHSATTPAAWSNTLKPSGTAAGPLTLAKDGATSYVIVIPAKPTSQDNKAAEDLALWLGKMTDATFAIVPDSTSPRDTEISIGRTNRLTDARVPQAGADLGNEGYAIGVEGQRLFLLGGKKRGAINAVYALLEEDFGCRWYSQSYTKIPHRSVLRFGPVPRSYVPRPVLPRRLRRHLVATQPHQRAQRRRARGVGRTRGLRWTVRAHLQHACAARPVLR